MGGSKKSHDELRRAEIETRLDMPLSLYNRIKNGAYKKDITFIKHHAPAWVKEYKKSKEWLTINKEIGRLMKRREDLEHKIQNK